MPSTFDLDELAGYAVEDRPAEAPQRPAARAGDAAEVLDDAESMRIMDALRFIPALDRPTWLRVGCALHHATSGSEHGYSVWSRWSLTSPTAFDPAEQRSTWQQLRTEHPKPVTLASIYALAQESGWRPRDDEALSAAAGVIRSAWQEMPPAWLYEPPEPQRYLLERPDGAGYLPAGCVALLAAAGGAGKTYLLLALGVSICARRLWLGVFAIGASIAPRVAILLGEEQVEQARRRIYHVCRTLGLDDAELRAVQEGLRILPLAGQLAPLVRAEQERIVATQEMRDLRALLDAGGPWGAVIADPLARFAGAEVEARNDYATQAVQHFESLTEAAGRPAVIVACHSSKAARREGKADSRGVTGLRDGARSELQLIAEGDIVRLRLDKANLSPPCEDVILRRREHGVLSAETPAEKSIRERTTAENDPQTRKRASRAAERQSRLEAARSKAVVIVGRTRGLALGKLADKVGGSDDIAREAIEAAVEAGELVAIKRGNAFQHYLPGDAPEQNGSSDNDRSDDAAEAHFAAQPERDRSSRPSPSTPTTAGRAARCVRPPVAAAAPVTRAGSDGSDGSEKRGAKRKHVVERALKRGEVEVDPSKPERVPKPSTRAQKAAKRREQRVPEAVRQHPLGSVERVVAAVQFMPHQSRASLLRRTGGSERDGGSVIDTAVSLGLVTEERKGRERRYHAVEAMRVRGEEPAGAREVLGNDDANPEALGADSPDSAQANADRLDRLREHFGSANHGAGSVA